MKPCLLQHFLEMQAELNPEKTALICNGESICYNDLYLKSNAAGFIFKSHKLNRHDRVGIFLDHSIPQVISMLGALYSDSIFVIINHALFENQILRILNDCNIKLLITSGKNRTKLNSFINQTEVKHVLYADEFIRLTEEYKNEKVINLNISDDISNIIYTSGSTGLPKGVVITHRNLIDGARIVCEYLEIGKEERILGLLPFNFSYGLNQLTTTLYKGATLILFQYVMPNNLLKIIQEEGITGLAAISPVWASVFNEKLTNLNQDFDFSRLRYITNAGGKLAVALIPKIKKLFKNTKLYLMYGLTETFRSTYLPPEELDRRPDSMGKAIPGVQVEVINEKGEICKPGEVGELIHRGGCITRGYWNNIEKTKEVYRPNPLLPPGNQFLETVVYSGDLVRKDEEGYLYYIGRKDHIIKTRGYRVSPTEVEELLLKYEGINEAVAFGTEDETNGQKINAVITISKEIKIEDIIIFCRKNAPFYLIPARIIIIDQIPKTANGKIDRVKVIEESLN